MSKGDRNDGTQHFNYGRMFPVLHLHAVRWHSGSAPWTIGAGAISAAVFLMLLRFFDVELPFAWLRILLCACVSAAGVAGGFAAATATC